MVGCCLLIHHLGGDFDHGKIIFAASFFRAGGLRHALRGARRTLAPLLAVPGAQGGGLTQGERLAGNALVAKFADMKVLYFSNLVGFKGVFFSALFSPWWF